MAPLEIRPLEQCIEKPRARARPSRRARATVFSLWILCLPKALAAEPQPFAELKFHAAARPLPSGSVTEEWPHFLGPHFNATTRETKLLTTWPVTGPKVVWEMASGEGYACPVIADGRLVFFHRVDGKETIDCLDPETGRRFWRFSYPVEYEDRYGFSPGPRSSAVLLGGRVFTAGVTAMLHCLDLASGKMLWRRDLQAEFKVPHYFFGYGPTPFAWKDRLIVNVGGKAKDGVAGTCVAAFDQATGKTLWAVEDTWGADYASPVVARIGGREVALIIAGGESKPSSGGLLTLDPETGKVFDRFPWRARIYETAMGASPAVIGERRVLVSESYEKGGTLLEFDDAMKSRQLWTQRGFGLHWMMPLARDGYLYGFAGRNPPDTEFRCVDIEAGKIMWSDDTRFTAEGRTQSFFRGSLLQAGERVFCLGEDGLFAEFVLTPQRLTVQHRARLFEAQSTWTLPALHRGLLYVAQNVNGRGGQPRRIICYDFRGE